jgi:hypothetical protein
MQERSLPPTEPVTEDAVAGVVEKEQSTIVVTTKGRKAWIYSWSCHRPYESDAGEDQKIREADEFQKVLVEMRGPWYLLPFLEAAIHFVSMEWCKRMV